MQKINLTTLGDLIPRPLQAVRFGVAGLPPWDDPAKLPYLNYNFQHPPTYALTDLK
ncbi:hypothetical protein Cal6303_0650 [Calothrix sp. PCC 6303]|nr:hypothetical protein Cal6303_0650 [Calothrix sp. PCC 6303]